MWPFSEMSLSTASLVGTIANWGLLVSLLAGLFSTFVIVKTTDVKEDHWEAARRESSERIAMLVTKGDEARAELGTAQADIAKADAKIAEANAVSAKANERAAALENDAAQARAEQERLKSQLAWRRLTKEQFDIIAASVRGANLDAPLDVVAPVGDVEAATFAAEIIRALKAGGLAVQGDAASAAIYMPLPPTGVIVGQPGMAQIGHPIAQALANARIQVGVELNAPALKLVIGTKPSQF
jgi:hypothetical protein